jgi:hypothetical protein
MIPITLIECIEYGEDNLRDITSIKYTTGFDNEAKKMNYKYNGIKLERINDMSGKTIIVNYYDTK